MNGKEGRKHGTNGKKLSAMEEAVSSEGRGMCTLHEKIAFIDRSSYII